MKKELRVVFMGTPDFAVEILKGLLEDGITVVGVVTAPDKPAGRGQQINQSAVKQFSSEKELTVLQPTNLKDPEFIAQLRALQADLFVVVAFRMLPEVVWGMPEFGTINLHASLLPNYRGAAPINWAVINGEKETGVSTFFIEKEIDTGKIIEQEKIQIGPNETAGEVHDRLMLLGAQVTVSTVRKIAAGNVNGIDQSSLMHGVLKSAPKIFRDDCKIDLNQPVDQVHNFIRGLSPYPAAWTELVKNGTDKKSFKLLLGYPTEQIVENATELKETKEGILIPCKDRYICITELQPEGKRKMHFKDFLAGNKLSDWKTS